MACFNPLQAYRTASGAVVFAQLRRHDVVASIDLPCGRCRGCRLERSRQWALRCTHEARLHDENSFVTLTYDNDHLPVGGSLRHRDVQLFFKRLRKAIRPKRVRYFMCGEYGERLGRPHYHLCLFGLAFPDRRYLGKTSGGADKFSSEFLSGLWPLGDAQLSDFSFKAAAYVARYCMEKVSGDEAVGYYQRFDSETGEIFPLVPEYSAQSSRPGIGCDYVRLYYADILATGTCVVDGREVKPPRYYDQKMRNLVGFENVAYQRYLHAQRCAEHSTPERLAVRDQVLAARLKFKKRHEGFQ